MTQKSKLFEILEAILGVAKEIDAMTQNQETVILHGSQAQMLTELASNKQKLILKLDELEDQFQWVYQKDKEMIAGRQDVARLQGLVSKVLEVKANITEGEERNRRLWASKGSPRVRAQSDRQPIAYVADQYKKHSKM